MLLDTIYLLLLLLLKYYSYFWFTFVLLIVFRLVSPSGIFVFGLVRFRRQENLRSSLIARHGFEIISILGDRLIVAHTIGIGGPSFLSFPVFEIEICV